MGSALFAYPVIVPVFDRSLYRLLLVRLLAASQQDHQILPVIGEIHPQPRSPVDPLFMDSTTDRANVREIALLQPRNMGLHLETGLARLPTQPVDEGDSHQ